MRMLIKKVLVFFSDTSFGILHPMTLLPLLQYKTEPFDLFLFTV